MHIHKYTNWKQYDWTGWNKPEKTIQSYPVSEIRENRICKKCGKMQDRKVEEK